MPERHTLLTRTKRLVTLSCVVTLAASPAWAMSESTAPGTTDSGKYPGMSANASRMTPGATARGEATGRTQDGTYTANANQQGGKGGSTQGNASSRSAAGAAGQE